jgi:CheY-like chemotaxis protein
MKRVLLYVDADAVSREIVRLLVEMSAPDIELVLFEDSADLLERLKALPTPPGLILISHELLQTAQPSPVAQLSSDPTPVIAVVSKLTRQEAKRLRAIGVDGALAKPLSLSTFADLLKRLFNGEIIWQVE